MESHLNCIIRMDEKIDLALIILIDLSHTITHKRRYRREKKVEEDERVIEKGVVCCL